MTAKLGPIRRVQLSERVASELRRAIFQGELAAGDHLVESELAERMQVSRGPIRQALRELEVESLVEVQSNGRTLVLGFSGEAIMQLYDARLWLEKRALQLACERITEDAVNYLQLLLDEMLSASSDGRQAMMAELDLAFHYQFFVIGGNRVLAQLWQMQRAQIHGLLEITDIINPRVVSIIERHQRILNAVAERDAERAQSELASHLHEAMQILLGKLSERRLVESPTPPLTASRR